GHANGKPYDTINPVCTGSPSCAYDPDPLQVMPGDSVEFENVGKLKHTATGDVDFSPRLPEIVQPTSSSNSFSTGKLEAGDVRRIGPFSLSGSIEYYCLIHGPSQMRGALSVTANQTTTTTTGMTTTSSTTTAASTTMTTGITTTTTTTMPPVVHDIVVKFAPNQPPFVIGKIVQVSVVVT